MRWTNLVLLCLILVAPGCGDDGLKLLGGDVDLVIGTKTSPLTYGVAVDNGQGDGTFTVALSTVGIGCDFDPAGSFPRGNYVLFSPSSADPVTDESLSVSVIFVTSPTSFHIHGSSGTVSIRAVTSDAVTGTIDYFATDDAGDITVGGDFSVTHCAP